MSAEPLSVITQPFRFGGWLDLAEVDSIGYATDGGLGGGGRQTCFYFFYTGRTRCLRV